MFVCAVKRGSHYFAYLRLVGALMNRFLLLPVTAAILIFYRAPTMELFLLISPYAHQNLIKNIVKCPEIFKMFSILLHFKM